MNSEESIAIANEMAGVTTGIDWGIVIGILGLCLTLYLALCSAFYSLVLKDATTRQHFIQFIEDKTWIRFYRKLVNWLLYRLQRWFGNRLSIQAFSLCLLWAFAYPSIFFIWAFSWSNGNHEFAGLTVFNPETLYRSWFLPGVLIYLAIFAALSLNIKRIDGAGRQLFSHWLSETWGGQCYRILCALVCALLVYTFTDSFWLIGLYFIFGYLSTAVAVAGAVAIAIAFAGADAIAGAGAGAVAVAIAIAVAVAGAVAGAGAGAGAVAVAVAGLLFYQEDYLISLQWSILLVMLPLTNACLDWLSWACSRHFLQQASHEDRVFPIIRDIAYDLILAIIFMLMMCILIPAGAEVLNALYVRYDQDVQFDWHSLALSARNDPWGEGLMVTLMVLSTLIPTVIHIVLASISVILQSFMGNPVISLLRKYAQHPSNIYLFNATGLITLYLVGIIAAIVATYQLFVQLLNLNVSVLLYDMTMTVWG